MRTLATFSNLGAAGLALSVIEGSGISGHLENVESSVNLSGGPPVIRLLVDDADFEHARAVLASVGPMLSDAPADPGSENK